MNTFENIKNKKETIAIVGLGYVGLPIAIAFAKKTKVIGFDINEEKINLYKSGIDPTNEVGNEELKKSSLKFTSDEKSLKEAIFYIVAVPTPVTIDNVPDISLIVSASEIIGRNLKKGSIVVYESTVYPGLTEEICIPILEKTSNLKCGIDFKVGYSPERINPGDKLHRIDNTIKIVSGIDQESLEEIAKIYQLVVSAGVYKAESIKVAEAAKVIENAQRDINIAFVNELAIIFEKMGIDTKEVLKASSTKWNFLNFQPGFVGGHCIGVDPYYLKYKAEQIGYYPRIITAGRRINNEMGQFVVQKLIKELIKQNIKVKKSKIAILGFTFKENCPDVRNTKIIDIINELKEYGVISLVTDSNADAKEVSQHYGINLIDFKQIKDIDVIIIAVAHDQYLNITKKEIDKMFKKNENKKIIYDLKGILEKKEFEEKKYIYWRL